MVELIAAVVGATVGVAAGGLGGMLRKDSEASMAVVRLTSSVEHIAQEITLLRAEIKNDRSELYPRINNIEQRLSVIEGKLS